MPLGVLPHNEQYTEEMVSILEHLHQYVPVCRQSEGQVENYSPIPFGGDQLTAARATTAKKARVTSQGKRALRGLVPFCADWHAKVNFIEVCLCVCVWRGGGGGRMCKNNLHCASVLYM